jgi:hypothetical protein
MFSTPLSIWKRSTGPLRASSAPWLGLGPSRLARRRRSDATLGHAATRDRQPIFARLLGAFTSFLLLASMLPAAQPAQAATTCTIALDPKTGQAAPTCPSFAPPELLNLSQPLYAATADQTAALQHLETQAVNDVITGHGLSPADGNAVTSWGRAEAQAELYALLVKAISASSPTSDQKSAVDWMTAVAQRTSIAAADDAGLEYVKWAGLDQSAYRTLIDSSSSTESDFTSFLSQAPQGGNSPFPLDATSGWCAYHSPAPFDSDYKGRSDPTCLGAMCWFLCNPPLPDANDFTKWGEADAQYSMLSSGDYITSAQAISGGIGASVAISVVVAASVPAYLQSAVAATEASWAAIDAFVTAATGATAGSTAAGAAAETAAVSAGGSLGIGATAAFVVIAAVVTAITESVDLANAAKVPAKLASDIASARSTPPSLTTLANNTSGGTTLFTLFVGATLPSPRNQTCDNSTISMAERATGDSQCLNLTDIPQPTPTDSQFVIQAKGSAQTSLSRSLTWLDHANGRTSNARLSGNWFITSTGGTTSQQLHITYTDWQGKEQNAWLLGNATKGFVLATFSPPTDGTTIDISTCRANDQCSFGSSTNYIGTDGLPYTASVQAFKPAQGAPTYTRGVEGGSLSFNANGFIPGGAKQPVTRQWRFQNAGCGIPCVKTDASPSYSDPVTGDTATHKWDTSGSFLVSLTATDAIGQTATTTLTAVVGDVPPVLQLTPTCAQVTIKCDPNTADPNTPVGIAGTFTHTGSLDNENVAVNWGDGSAADVAGIGPNSIGLVGNVLQLSGGSGSLTYNLFDTHTYTKPGAYTGTVTLTDWGGGRDIRTFTKTITGTQTISFPSISARSAGSGAFGLSATGGASGQPVSYAVTGDSSVCSVSNPIGATGNAVAAALKPGTCTITASQAGSSTYHAAPNVSQSFTVQPGSASPAPAASSDVRLVAMTQTGTGTTEVHILPAASNYQQFSVETGSALEVSSANQWAFAFAPNNDLYAFKLNHTDSQHTEVHILTAASQYRQFSVHTATPLPEVEPQDWTLQVAANGDVYAIQTSDSSSGKVEVHTLTAASNFQQLSAATPTAQDVVDPTQWEFLLTSTNDLLGVRLAGTASGKTEVHILSADSNYQQYRLEVPTALAPTDRSTWQFSMGANDDLIGVLINNTGSGKTEVHRLSASSNYGQFNVEIATPLPQTGPGFWNFGIGSLVYGTTVAASTSH